jgi:hypothetical protein
MPPQQSDEIAMAELEQKLALVRDRVSAVALGLQTGFYLYGTGGIGKSYTVLTHLDQLEVSYKLFNSRMTGKGLFLALDRAPDAIHVLEDMERLTNDKDAQGVLRSALWAQDGRDREITWTTATGGQQRTTFRGGLILISNRPLEALPELRALATRIAVLRLEVTEAEATALMRDLAARGYEIDGKPALQPAEASKVTERLLRECRAAGCPLDLRLQVNCYRDYMQWESNQSHCGWKDLVASRVREAASHFKEGISSLSREERQALDRAVVRKILGETADVREQVRLYGERTGKSRTSFFRRKQEIDSREFDAEAGEAGLGG